MAAPYSLHVVDSPARRQQFLELPDAFYRDLPCYVRPNNQEVEAVFDPQRNKLFSKGGEAIRWVLLDAAGQPAGRIAAFVNPTLRASEPRPVGGFGFFECVDDQAAANQLLDAAREWLLARGMEAMDGPINFGERDRFWGLLVEGFDRMPVYGMFYHPPYYRALLETYGLQTYFRQITYLVTVAEPQHPRIVAKWREFVAKSNVRFAHASKNDLEKLARDLQYVYSLAWGRHEGVADMTLDQARRLVQKMKAIMDEQIVWFAYVDDEPVAFFIGIPGLNQIFSRTGPNLNWWGKLKFAVERLRWQRRDDKIAYGILYGVIPAFQGSGIDAALVLATQEHYVARGYKEMEMSWIGDFNPKMMAVCRAVGGRPAKTHHTYRLYFDPTVPFERLAVIR